MHCLPVALANRPELLLLEWAIEELPGIEYDVGRFPNAGLSKECSAYIGASNGSLDDLKKINEGAVRPQ